MRSLDLLIKDWSDGGQKPRIKSPVMASTNRNLIRPSKGFAPKPGRKPLHLWGDKVRDRHNGNDRVERRSESPVHIQYDTNIWKSHAARRLQTTIRAPSAITLPGTEPRLNRLLAEHLTAEVPKSITYDGASGVAWQQTPARDNDWWDCLVGNCVAASMLGCSLTGETAHVNQQARTFVLPGGASRR